MANGVVFTANSFVEPICAIVTFAAELPLPATVMTFLVLSVKVTFTLIESFWCKTESFIAGPETEGVTVSTTVMLLSVELVVLSL